MSSADADARLHSAVGSLALPPLHNRHLGGFRVFLWMFSIHSISLRTSETQSASWSSGRAACFCPDALLLSPHTFPHYIPIHGDSDHRCARPVVSCPLLNLHLTNRSKRRSFQVSDSHTAVRFLLPSFTLLYLNQHQQIAPPLHSLVCWPRPLTHQRGSAGASAQRQVEGRAAQLQLLQVAVRYPDVGRQRQTLVQVLRMEERHRTHNESQHCTAATRRR